HRQQHQHHQHDCPPPTTPLHPRLLLAHRPAADLALLLRSLQPHALHGLRPRLRRLRLVTTHPDLARPARRRPAAPPSSQPLQPAATATALRRPPPRQRPRRRHDARRQEPGRLRHQPAGPAPPPERRLHGLAVPSAVVRPRRPRRPHGPEQPAEL
ncbi:hypothetical protein LOZ54_006815, partial [Ophidiomyces ophidiicola]